MIGRIFRAVLLIACVSLGFTTTALARGQFFGYVNQGGSAVSVNNFQSLTKVQRSFPSSTVSVYVTGTTTLATIYSDAAGTAKANPFTASSDASFLLYSDSSIVDITFSGTGITTGCGGAGQLSCISAFTWTGVVLTQSTGTSINVLDFGVKGDAKGRIDGVATIASTTFTSATATFSSSDTGKLILIYGAGAAGVDYTTTITFVNATTVTLLVAPSTSVNPAVFYWGTDDTSKLNSTIAAVAGKAVSPIVAGGQYLDTTPEIFFPDGIYLLTGELDFTTQPGAKLRSTGLATLVQADRTKRTLVFTGGYVVSVQGLQLIGGKYAIYFNNANSDNASLLVRDCNFQIQENYSIYAVASVSLTTTGIPYSTGTLSATAGLNSFTGSGTVWSDANHAFKDLHVTGGGNDDYYKIAEVTSGTTLTSNIPAVTTYNAGTTYEIGDYHLSAQILIDHCRFFNVGKVLFTTADRSTVRDSWVELYGVVYGGITKPKFKADTAAFRTLGTANSTLVLSNMIGVPLMGTFGVDLIAGPRWIDQFAGTVLADNHTRFGGEFAGMATVWFFVPYNDVSTFTQGGRTIIVDSEIYAGQTADVSYSGILILRPNGRAATKRENVPQLFVYKHNHGHAGTPIINNVNLLDTTTFFTAVGSKENKFRYDIGPNDTGTDEVGLQGTWNAAQSSLGFVRFTGTFKYSASMTWPAILTQTCNVQTLAVTGAVDGDTLFIGMPNVIATVGSFSWSAWVSATDVVSVRICNPTTGSLTPGTGTVNITVVKPKWFTD